MPPQPPVPPGQQPPVPINDKLATLYTVHKFFELTDKEAWLREHGATIDAVVTGGHTGIPQAMLERLPGLKVVAALMAHLSRSEAEAFYAVHKARPFFADLVKFMISGPVMIQVLEGEGAIAKNREIMGATSRPTTAFPDHMSGGITSRAMAVGVRRWVMGGDCSKARKYRAGMRLTSISGNMPATHCHPLFSGASP